MSTLTARIVAMIIGALLIVGLLVFGVRQCEKRRNQASQARVERSQAEAASNSAADAIATVARSGESERASEDLTRSNEKEIRNAEGAKDRVNSGVDLAGRRALCLRDAYRDRAECRMFRTPAK